MSERRPSPFKTLLDSEVCTLIEAAPDVYQVRFKNRAANVYLVIGSRRTILIDAGLSSNYPHLLTCLAHVGVTPDKIVQRIAEGLDAERIVRNGDKRASLPDTANRQRTITHALTLLERAGELPGAKVSGPATIIMTKILMLGEGATSWDDPGALAIEKTDE